MTEQVFVPANLLEVFDHNKAGPALLRQVVAACVFGGGWDADWMTPEALRAGKQWWPAHFRGRPVRNVMTVLLELEQLGAITGFAPTEGGYAVTRKERAA